MQQLQFLMMISVRYEIKYPLWYEEGTSVSSGRFANKSPSITSLSSCSSSTASSSVSASASPGVALGNTTLAVISLLLGVSENSAGCKTSTDLSERFISVE